MGRFTTIIENLKTARNNIVGAINDVGELSLDEELNLKQIRSSIYQIDAGVKHIRTGAELFCGDTTLKLLPDHLPIKKFTSMYKMCYGCSSLQYVGQLETGNVEDMMWAFYGCSALDCIDGLITSKIKSTYELFHGCKSLQSIWYPLDFSNVESPITYCFVSCSALKNVEFSGSINVDIAMNGSPKLTVASLTSLLAALADFSEDESGEEHLCNIGKTNLAKLTDTQKAVATDKGWTLE